MRFRLNYFNVGPRLTLTFVVLAGLILAGNGLLIWQFRIAGMETERLTGANQQVIAVLRLQERLLSFHQRLSELVQSMDARQIAAEAEPLRTALLDQIQQTRNAITGVPSGTRVDPAFLPTLDAIAIDLPSQVDAVNSLAELGSWDVVRVRIANGMRVMEGQISMLLESIDRDSSEDLAQTSASMRAVQKRIFAIVPLMAISTFSIAAFFAWAVTRRIVEMRAEERISERMRIAGELHDNLLQGIISAKMLVHLAADQLPPESPVVPFLGRVAQVMHRSIDEGRNTIRGFREQAVEDLAQAFSRLQEELQMEKQIDCRVQVKGRPKTLRLLIRNDVYSVGREALVNSFRHSGAQRIEIELEYDDLFRISVRDDGCGIGSDQGENGRAGHFGLPGMRERAERIGGKLRIGPRAGGGTEVELCVPGNIAFDSSTSSPVGKRFRKAGAKSD